MLMRLLAGLILLLPTLTLASDLTSECTIGKFVLSLNDYGINKNYTPVDKSVGNHNPAVLFHFIKYTLIEDQAYSLEGQKFSIIDLDSHIEIYTNLSSKKTSNLKPFVFNSKQSSCSGNAVGLVCNSNNQLSAHIKIDFDADHTSGTLSVFMDDNSESILTKHKFSCN